jgi:ribonucleoside-diphosphate reductase alpha chain
MALAPEQTGVGIRRHFTRPDVHPYDELTWERRDSRITNWSDGAIAFEQLGVEFPTSWSINATNIVTQKYFRGTVGTPERETSLKAVIDRVADTISTWGTEGGYFTDDAEAEAYRAELKHLLVTQKAAFNSPVWFNIGVAGVPQQASACFILAVDDAMDSILNWYREEGVIFKGGSGAGVNLSKIRSSVEYLKGGGTASGPVSFMRGADASAGTIKSGGKTRRAAKMVILDVSHPDIEEFIWVKAREEKKIRALEEAGFDMSLDGKDMASVQYQNANNSVRVSDEFMQAVVDDADWHLRAVTTDEVVRTVKARDLMHQFAQATWECADPGMQYDTTINRWHTAANTDRINGSNPCFPGDAMVHTDKGLIAFVDLVDRARLGETFGVYTHDATSPEAPAERVEITSPDAIMITGSKEIVRLQFSDGSELRCTPNHRIWTTNRGWVRADELSTADDVKRLDVAAPAVSADRRLPVPTDVETYAEGRDRRAVAGLVLPEKWSEDLAHYLGWLVGDGCISGDVATTVYGSTQERSEVLPRHQALLAELNGGRVPTPSIQPNGTAQLRVSRSALVRFFEALGVSDAKAGDKRVPWSINEAPPEIAAAFLCGLFDADGCVHDGKTSRYVGLGSASKDLVQDVQRLLTTFGIAGRIYATRRAGDAFTYVDAEGTFRIYEDSQLYDLRVSATHIATFDATIGFDHPAKSAALESLLGGHRFHRPSGQVRLAERTDDGVELTYNLSEPRNHSYVVDGVCVSNCSEYMHIDNSACNLASINLLAFQGADGRFDVEGFKQACAIMFTGQEILVGRADYPTEPIGDNSRRFRQLGLGYANLGALLMATGAPYDSEVGRAWAAAITALMTGHAYEVSARTAARMGAFSGYEENSEHMLRVLNMHRTAAADIDEELVPSELLSAAQQSWDEACELAEQFGVRNSQASVLAPTGCLVGGSMVTTDRGVVRLRSLGDPDGAQWQDLDARVLTDDGEQDATKFYINGLERVVDVTTDRGYHIAGTTKHRIKVVDEAGAWVWRRFADVRSGDLVPLARGGLVGAPQPVALPPLGEGYRWAAEHHVRAPEAMTAELAELVGYFMGDGSLHARGLRLCVAEADLDVIDHLERLSKSLFGIEARVRAEQGYASVEISSVQLVDWWRASGFAKRLPNEGHSGKGWLPHIPDAVLHANDAEVYSAFLRGLFAADGTVTAGYPSWTTTSLDFSRDVQTLTLSLGYVTTRSFGTSGRGSRLAILRLLNQASAAAWLDEIGFLSGRKAVAVASGDHPQAARHDHIPVSRQLVERVAPNPGRNRRAALQELRRSGAISRSLATQLVEESGDAELAHLLGFFFDRVSEAVLGDEELTYDISVPANVTYVANGFVSHNTIGLMMDCDTTGIEPDLGLVKTKKLVGGGTMSIVNQTVPRALRNLGYDDAAIAEIVVYIDVNKTIVGAPHLAPEHLAVFACSMGDNTIHYTGHVKMMAAVQPFISGAISKTVNMPTEATVEDVEQIHIDAWRMGVKAVAIYRDGCKVAQPLSMTKKDVVEAVAAEGGTATEVVERVVEKVIEKVVTVKEPVRRKLPRSRASRTFEFRVADCKGFVNVGEYEDGRPGEIFVRISKQGSTLAGIMDAFAVSVSYGLQYGVPLRAYVETFTNTRFEPAGMTDDPDIRIASSLVDYMFRRLAVEYLTYEERAELGILTVSERTQPTLPGVEETVTETVQGSDAYADPKSVPSASALAQEIDDAGPMPPRSLLERAGVLDSTPAPEVPQAQPEVRHSDAPYCMQCGVQMMRAGSCHACPSCGTTSGCS